jgi:hypothetical protein
MLSDNLRSRAPMAAGPYLARFAPEDPRADFAQMYGGLKAAHFDLYAFTPQCDLDRRYAQVLGQIDRPMTRFEVKVLFELFAAEVRMGHTRIDSPTAEWTAYRKSGGKGFPLQIHILDDRVHVATNLSGVDAIRPGDEITRLNGQAMSAWLERTERHVSAETSYMAHSLMDYDFAIYLWVELGAADAFDIGAMEQFALAHTGLLVGYPKARIVRPNGDLRAKGVTPDIVIRVPIVPSWASTIRFVVV